MPDDTVWQAADLARTYLEGVRGAIPLAQEQIQVMLRLISHARPRVGAVLDLGCGDGILGQAVLDRHPGAQGVGVDFSAPMLAAARRRLDGRQHCVFLQLDYGEPEWLRDVAPLAPFDVIVSGFSIHHQPDGRKKALYGELYGLLAPGGIFLNLEHVASPGPWGEAVFNDHFVESLVRYHRSNGATRSRRQIEQEFYTRPDRAANILASVERQCDWLRDIGFRDVDCFLKIFELALFGGLRPDGHEAGAPDGRTGNE